MTAILSTEGIDAGVPWHYGDPLREQRDLDTAGSVVDLSHRGVVTITGPDRLSWLHSLTTQHVADLAPGVGVTTLVLSPQGHIEHALYGVDDGETFWAHTEPGAAAPAAAWLDRMRFMMRVEVADRSADYAVVWRSGEAFPDPHSRFPDPHPTLPDPHSTFPDPHPTFPELVEGQVSRRGPDSLGGYEVFVPRVDLESALAGFRRAGTWAYEARRIAVGVPRIGVDTDHRTIPNELGIIGPAVHLDKGCYRGQETIARIHNLGRPPRRLVLLHLDGSTESLPTQGSPLELDGRAQGFVGSSARHHELGPIALGLVKRNVDPAATFVVDSIAAAQELIVDPEVGLHVRPRLA